MLYKLINSISDVVKGLELIPKNPRMMVGEVFYDRSILLRDVETTMSGMDLFKRWFSQRNKGIPLSNV